MRRARVHRLAAAALMVLFAGCSGPSASIEPTVSPGATLTAEASPSIEPTATSFPSVGPSATPEVAPEPSLEPNACPQRAFDGPWTIDPLFSGSAVRVSVAELNLRAGPCTAAKRVGTLQKGDIVIVAGYPYGPFKANGYPWYAVERIQHEGADGGLPPLPLPPISPERGGVGGWIAANDGSKAYVTPVEARCPSTVDLETVKGMLPAERLACFHEPITLQGSFGCGGCGGAGGPQATPAWLATGFQTNNLRLHWDMDEYPISIFFKPSGPDEPPQGSIIRVTLHVDDPAAQKCEINWGLEEPPFEVAQKVAIAYCREQLVVDSYDNLGMDPDYGG
jgi:hypothetical protein